MMTTLDIIRKNAANLETYRPLEPTGWDEPEWMRGYRCVPRGRQDHTGHEFARPVRPGAYHLLETCPPYAHAHCTCGMCVMPPLGGAEHVAFKEALAAEEAAKALRREEEAAATERWIFGEAAHLA